MQIKIAGETITHASDWQNQKEPVKLSTSQYLKEKISYVIPTLPWENSDLYKDCRQFFIIW